MPGPQHETGTFSYADYLTWPEDERWELIHGIAYNMSPAPGRNHQLLLGDIFAIIKRRADHHGCQAYVAPFDVRLSTAGNASDQEIETVVQPDISLFCDLTKLDDRGAHGAPDLVVEVLSPSTGYKDQTEKLALYESAGVREYWIVNPDAAYVMVYRLESDGRFGKPDYYRRDDALMSNILGDPPIQLSEMFRK